MVILDCNIVIVTNHWHPPLAIPTKHQRLVVVDVPVPLEPFVQCSFDGKIGLRPD